jgi:hypothetical protein
VAAFRVQIASAARAKSFAVLAAEGLRGQGQKHLLPEDVFEHKTFLVIIPDFRLRCADGMLGRTQIDP